MGKKGKKILYADDTKENRVFAELVFMNSDYELFLAVDGKEALEIFEKENPDIIITDLYMPNLNGIQLFLEVRKKNKKIPIIAFTGADFEDNDPEIMDLGFNDFLHKPIDDQQLKETVAKFI
jgi:CheY-like chemotaxis protein